jgi:hypothetical protein
MKIRTGIKGKIRGGEGVINAGKRAVSESLDI